ncbi:hypothetical protein [Coralloluteibacterium thermophilus]|uniref:Uncharacterized protein n=1 Tax=Coralloluteibacterium thermophilum TaxID=2707049 RepID=A0ABV9NQU8_9GAMM
MSAAILALDPGTTQTGVVVYRSGRVVSADVMDNGDVVDLLPRIEADELAVEMVASYGMAVGKEVFRTVWWTGRFAEAWARRTGCLPMEVFRKDVKLHLCNSPRAKDANIRQALIDMLGPQGTKKAPGPTYGVKSHAWAALAVAVTADARLRQEAA